MPFGVHLMRSQVLYRAAHQHQGFSCGSLAADAAGTRAADQKMQELIAAEEKPQTKKKSKKKKVRHS